MQQKWYILFLIALIATGVVAAPSISMSVLFEEISADLNLSLVQVGFIWGIGALPGIFTSLLGGAVVDRLGARRVLLGCIILMGLSGASRGLAVDFYTLVFASFLTGMLVTVTIMGMYKSIGIWFPSQQLGLAAGVLSIGMALGFLLGSLLSASFLSPWLGGWRNVLFFYGAIALLLAVLWQLTPAAPGSTAQHRVETPTVPMRQAIRHIASLKAVWLLAFALLGYSGCIQATLGYLPLYLRQAGWSDVTADTAISSFHFASMILVLPIVLLSDHLGNRKKLLVGMGLVTTLGIGTLSQVHGNAIWGAIILAGMVRDGFMALFMTQVIETDHVGPLYSGTATGFVQVLASLGNTLAPPLGNQLAAFSPATPFVFWAILAGAGTLCLVLARPHKAH